MLTWYSNRCRGKDERSDSRWALWTSQTTADNYNFSWIVTACKTRRNSRHKCRISEKGSAK